MMPPPFPPKRVYYSYFERKHQEEEFDDEESVVDEATRVKREADNEENMYIKCRKYLQVKFASNCAFSWEIGFLEIEDSFLLKSYLHFKHVRLRTVSFLKLL